MLKKSLMMLVRMLNKQLLHIMSRLISMLQLVTGKRKNQAIVKGLLFGLYVEYWVQ